MCSLGKPTPRNSSGRRVDNALSLLRGMRGCAPPGILEILDEDTLPCGLILSAIPRDPEPAVTDADGDCSVYTCSCRQAPLSGGENGAVPECRQVEAIFVLGQVIGNTIYDDFIRLIAP